MSVQWYPGHMHKARQQLAAVMPAMDLVIEVLDARIPYSSENPLLAELRGDTPCIRLLNKKDLADHQRTEEWQAWLEQAAGVKTLATSLHESAKVRGIIELATKMVPHKVGSDKDIEALIIGIPNVGKSTIINTLAQRKIAKTGNEPAITKQQQRIRLSEDLVLFDTPGMLWPKVENPDSGYRLAVTGAIRDTAIDHTEIAYYAAELLMQQYPQRLKERYELLELPATEDAFMSLLAKQRGCVTSGGRVDYDRVSKLFLQEIRSGKLGALTLETPAMAEREEVLVKKLREEKDRKDRERKERFKKKNSRRR